MAEQPRSCPAFLSEPKRRRSAHRLKDDWLVLTKHNVEFFHGLLGQFDAIDDKEDPFGIARLEKAPNERSAEERFAGAHFEQEFPSAGTVELFSYFVERRDLIPAYGDVGVERTKIVRLDRLTTQWTGRLQIL